MNVLVRSIALSLFLLAGTASATCVGDKLPPLVFQVDANQATVRNATANAVILFIGYGRSWDQQRFTSQFERYRSFITADAEGTATLTVRNSFAANAVFAAIELSTGRCGSVSSSVEPGQDRRKNFDRSAIKQVNGKAAKLIAGVPRAYLVLVRPDEGVWDLLAGDGSAVDDDQTFDGNVSFDFGKLKPAGKSAAAPDGLQRGDVLLLFFPHQPALAFTRVEE